MLIYIYIYINIYIYTPLYIQTDEIGYGYTIAFFILKPLCGEIFLDVFLHSFRRFVNVSPAPG